MVLNGFCYDTHFKDVHSKGCFPTLSHVVPEPVSPSLENKSPSSAMGHRHRKFADGCWRPPESIMPIQRAKVHGSAESECGSQQRGSVTDLGRYQCSPPTRIWLQTEPQPHYSQLSFSQLEAGRGSVCVFSCQRFAQRLKGRRRLVNCQEEVKLMTSAYLEASKARASGCWERLQQTGFHSGRCFLLGILFFSEQPCTSS